MSVGWGQDCIPSDVTWYDEFNCDIEWTVFCESFDLDGDGQYSVGETFLDGNENGYYDLLGEIELWGECYNIEETTILCIYLRVNSRERYHQR